jgi:hypothetical protein
MIPVSPFRKGYWFIGETDLLVVACFVPGQKHLHDRDKVTKGGKSVLSEDVNFVLTGVAVIYCLRKGATGP